MANGIILLGANGSGKTTLGRELARVLNFAHLDVEDYWFYKTSIPYASVRPCDERNALIILRARTHIHATGANLHPMRPLGLRVRHTVRRLNAF